jgi:hypothetical protein
MDTLDNRFPLLSEAERKKQGSSARLGTLFSTNGINPQRQTMGNTYSFGALADSGYEYLVSLPFSHLSFFFFEKD